MILENLEEVLEHLENIDAKEGENDKYEEDEERLVGTQSNHKTSKQEAMEYIDTLKNYCTEKYASEILKWCCNRSNDV